VLTSQQEKYDWYREMRKNNPVHYDEKHNTWQVFRYQDVQEVLQNYKIFSSQSTHGGDIAGASLLELDPPRHQKLRALVSQAFTTRQITLLQSQITALVHKLLDSVIPTGEMDVIADLAYPLPTIVIAELLGVPSEDHAQFKQWSDTFSEELPQLKPGDTSQAQQQLAGYILQILEQRSKEPKDDLISSLLTAEIDGEHLSPYDILATSALLLVAGHETTTNLLGNTILCLSDHPDALAALRTDPTLIPGALEEVLRYQSPVISTPRRATENVQLGNVTIKAKDLVTVQIGSANRDETAFPDPDRFDIRRTPNRHLGFGHGIHFCLGAPLARLESKIALTILLERLPDLHLKSGIQLEQAAGAESFAQGVKSLPIVFKA
jgi:cytochrome P450